MIEPANQKAIYRILIALDAFQENHSTLELAVALAARKQAELMTLFIEDLNLAHFAGLPFASEIDLVSFMERKMDILQMTRSFRSQAQKLASLLEQITLSKQVTCSLKVVRGHYMQEALSTKDVMDVLFLNRTVGKYGKSTLQRKVIRESEVIGQAAVQNAVCILYDGSTVSDRALSLACDLAAVTHKELVVLLQSEKQTALQLRQQATSNITLDILTNYLIISPHIRDDELISLLEDRKCGILVLSAGESPAVYQQASLFMDELQRPVVLVR